MTGYSFYSYIKYIVTKRYVLKVDAFLDMQDQGILAVKAISDCLNQLHDRPVF